MWQAFCKMVLRLAGWTIIGGENLDIPKAIVPVVPHTSNWDFPLGLFTRWSIEQDIQFIAKKSLFIWPIGWIFRGLGGHPVDRSKSNNFVEAVIQEFNEKERFLVAIAPEGTRGKVDKLKTGFYHIAKGANIPIIPCSLDYEKGVLIFAPPFYPTDDQEADFKFLDDFYRQSKGKNPELGYLHE